MIDRLTLTSPYTASYQVRNAQLLLADNVYGTFYTEDVGIVYDVMTAQATYRAKYWLGFRKPDQVYDTNLRDLLLENKRLPILFRLRRKWRLNKASKVPLRAQVFSDAERWIGAEETLTAAFVTKVYKQAGSKFDYTYVPFILNDALAGRNNLTITTNPQHGDLVILDKDGVPTGVEFFNDWLPNGRGRFKTIGIKNNAIARTERSIHSVAGFVHVSR